MSVFIIAEAGVNHNGDMERARRMIDTACEAGVDAIKFQTFKAEKVASPYAPKAHYQLTLSSPNESQIEMLKKLELTPSDHEELIHYCRRKGIMFLSTPFDLESIDVLNEFGLDMFKIPSGEITNLPYLKKVGSLKKRVILSTGMAEMKEIKDALKIVTIAGTLKDRITVLHCTSAYPTPYEDVHLRAMEIIRDELNVDVGYSDHTLGVEVSIAAVARGATVIEKHFTLDRTMEGPDHKASLEPGELKFMVEAIRHVEKALGATIKRPSPSELVNRTVVRKSIVASQDIEKGDLFTETSITVKRPGTGISPMLWDTVVGRPARRRYTKDEQID